MGTFSVPIEVGSADRSTWREVSVLVDTGSTFTWLPGELLRELGHAPESQESFNLGDGRVTQADIGSVPVRINGKVHSTICAFATAEEQAVLGAVTLQEFLLAPDPVNHRLVPVVGLRVSRKAL
jgi:predicted aspartyl protease